MSEQDKHDARRQAHEAGIQGTSKMTAEDAQEAVSQVQEGADPQEAKTSAKQD